MNITFSGTSPKGSARVHIMNEKETYVSKTPSGDKEIYLGAGEIKKMTKRKYILLVRKLVATARSYGCKKVSVEFDDLNMGHLDVSEEQLAETIAVNFMMANYEFVRYKTEPKEGWKFVDEIVIVGKVSSGVKKVFEKGRLIGECVNASRDLVNTPGSDMPPSALADEAKKALRGTKAKVKVLQRKDIEKLEMGGILGVSKASNEEPRFVIMEHMGGKSSEKPIVLVGKGVTFDTGGNSIKPGDAMLDMHMDMSGAAAVIQTMAIVAKLGIKKNVIGLVPAVENMVSGNAFRPGDILRTMSGKTIEVLNTDAEGRIILADALGYAKRYDPRLVVDVATLTGAALVALGQHATALFATSRDIQDKLQYYGEESGDYMWPLPLWDEYEEEVKGNVGDWINTGKSRYGGTITAAMFLKQFAEGYPWAHLDMAPRMTPREGEYLSKGSAGAPVRMLFKLVEEY